MTVSLAILLEHLIHEFSTRTHRAAHSPSLQRVNCVLNVISVTMRIIQKTVTSWMTSREMEKKGRAHPYFMSTLEEGTGHSHRQGGVNHGGSSSSNFITVTTALTACDVSELSCLFCPYTWSTP